MLRSEPGMAVLIKNRPTSISTGGGDAEHGCRDLIVIRVRLNHYQFLFPVRGLVASVLCTSSRRPWPQHQCPRSQKSVKEHCVWFLFFGPPRDLKNERRL